MWGGIKGVLKKLVSLVIRNAQCLKRFPKAIACNKTVRA